MARLATVLLVTALFVAAADAARVYDGRVAGATCVIPPEHDAVTAGPPESTRRGCETAVTAPIAMDGPWISEC